MLTLLLAQEDYNVVTASGMEEAIRLSQTEKFDLYVLDKRLPDGSGIELCQRLQRLTPGVPCIFYSGDAYEIHRLQAMQAGADAYVAKPNIEALISAVHELLIGSECATK
jgi:DNA-binding response OmpR family regulator